MVAMHFLSFSIHSFNQPVSLNSFHSRVFAFSTVEFSLFLEVKPLKAGDFHICLDINNTTDRVHAVMSPSPSFNSFSNSNLAEIAARVVEEFRVQDGVFAGNFDEFYCQKGGNAADISESAKKDGGKEDGEFEFASVTWENPEAHSTVSADEIFHDGKILPVYPTVNCNRNSMNSGSQKGAKIGPPLRKLFAEERETFIATSSSSSSDVDELDGVPADTYCEWRPKEAEEGRWKRSSFPGSPSKKWKLKELLQRSFSVGRKDSLVLLPRSDIGRSKGEEETIKESPVGRRNSRKEEGLVLLSPSNGGRKNVSNNVKRPPAAPGKPTPPPYNRYSSEKRRSYLPYRQHQVGFFAYMNGLGKNLHPF